MTTEALRPLLRKHPDGRRGARAVFEPHLLPYVALLLGAPLAALLAVWNAMSIRRYALALTSLTLGVAGWIAFGKTLDAMWDVSGRNGALVLVAGRAVSFATGMLLYVLMQPYVRGHTILGGEVFAARPTYVAAFAVALMLPLRVLLLLMGLR